MSEIFYTELYTTINKNVILNISIIDFNIKTKPENIYIWSSQLKNIFCQHSLIT